MSSESSALSLNKKFSGLRSLRVRGRIINRHSSSKQVLLQSENQPKTKPSLSTNKRNQELENEDCHKSGGQSSIVGVRRFAIVGVTSAELASGDRVRRQFRVEVQFPNFRDNMILSRHNYSLLRAPTAVCVGVWGWRVFNYLPEPKCRFRR